MPDAPSPTPDRPPRTVSSPGQRAVSVGGVRTAARTEPLPPEPPKPPLERVAQGAADFGHSLLAFAREGVRDFKSRDRFFKYKALIVVSYVLLSITTFGIACPGAGVRTLDMGARVVVGGAADRPVWLIKNESRENWTDVTVIINGHYRAAVGMVPANKNLAVTPLQLIGNDGRTAPADLRAQTLELKTADGDVELIREGRVVD